MAGHVAKELLTIYPNVDSNAGLPAVQQVINRFCLCRSFCPTHSYL